jgi:hypothetical protein
MKKTLLVLFIATAALCSSVAYLFDCAASLLAPIRSFARERVAMLVAFVGFCFMSFSVNAADLAEGITFLSVLTETWSLLPWYGQVVGVLWLLVPMFSFIVSATDTPVDDSLWGKWIYPLLEMMALTIFKSKQSPGDGILPKPYKKVW